MPSSTSTPLRTRVTAALLGLWCLALVAMTLRDESPSHTISAVAQWVSALGLPLTFNQAEAIGNVGIFIPLGLLAQLLVQQGRPRWTAAQRWRAALLVTLAGGAASLGIELIQGWLLPGRVASLQDVALNTLGTAIGAALGATAAALLVRRRAGGR
ncbi:hypothetical protein GCM10010401_23480 [Rarobacter faecitabidus]|uniref:VanZ like protein n=1 Tax=Rarobacter faecitabidus TaxID=13243 RepID=A0A542ZVW3_RARFA|nr:VanZ family protein [Rarobacter faecitabidus]TQL64508.1 VanZ like protein [Rarobacter faecitabidus]